MKHANISLKKKPLPQHIEQKSNKPLENCIVVQVVQVIIWKMGRKLFMVKYIQVLRLAHIHCNKVINIPKPY